MKSHRPPLRRCATKDGLGGRRCSWRLNTMPGQKRQGSRRRACPGGFRPIFWCRKPGNMRRIWASLAEPSHLDLRKDGGAMPIRALGYAGFGSADLDDWRQFGTGLIGLQAVERGNSLLAFRMDDRKQRIVIDRAMPRRRALLRLGGRGCGRSRRAGRPARNGRRQGHGRTGDAGRCAARSRPDFVSAIPPATGWRHFTAPRSTRRRSVPAARSPASAPARSASATPC